MTAGPCRHANAPMIIVGCKYTIKKATRKGRIAFFLLFLLKHGSLTPKNFEITRKASNGFIFLSNLYFLLPRYS